MGILNPRSLIQTVDRFNEAVVFGWNWRDEAAGIVEWASGRLGQKGGYAGSFALTDQDWQRDFRLFTGERITTKAGRAHVIAQETTRMLKLIEQATGFECQVRIQSEQRLSEQIFETCRTYLRPDGMYCCSTCSIALWRSMAAGVFARQESVLSHGVSSLRHYRKASGGWQPFPFYYTIMLLNGLEGDAAKKELRAHRGTCERRLLLLRARNDKCSKRRRALLEQVIQ